MEFDYCFVSYSNLDYDARSYNLIEYAKNKKFKVSTYSLTNASNSFYLESNLYFKVDKNKRFIVNWLKFFLFGLFNLKKIKAKKYFACDLYSLIFLKLIFINSSKIIYDSREIFSALATLSKNRIKQKILAVMEKIVVRNIKKIVVSGELDAEYLRKYYQDKSKKFFIIKNLPKRVEIKKSDYLRNKYQIAEDKTILIYQGVLLEGRGLLPTLNFLRDNDNYVLVIIGDGPFKRTILNEITKHKLENKVFIHQSVRYKELVNITATADIGLSLIEPLTFSYELALPNKLFEYLYAGIPVLVTNLPAMANFVMENDVGVVIPKDLDIQDIKLGLEKIRENYQVYKDNILKLKDLITYDSQNLVLEQIFNSID